MDEEIRIVVTTDPAAVSEARRLATPRQAPIDRLLQSLPVHPEDPRVARATAQGLSQLLRSLEDVASDTGASGPRRVGAAGLLLALAPDTGWRCLETLLDGSEPTMRRKVLFVVGDGARTERSRAIVARGLSDPDAEVREIAVGVALRSGMGEAVAPELVTSIVDRLLGDPDGGTWSRISGLRALLALSDGEGMRRAREGLHLFVRTRRSSRCWRDAVLALIEHGSADDEAWLWSTLRDPPELYVAGRALVALARLGKMAVLGDLEPWTKDRRVAVHAVEAIGVAARGSGSPDAIRMLQGAAANLDDRGPGTLMHALLLVGGPAMRPALVSHLVRLKNSVLHRVEVMNVLWILRSMRPSAGLRQLFDMGISTVLADERELAGLDAEAESTLMPYSITFREVQRGNIVAVFDAEASQVPCGHDRPLRLLEDFSRGHFLPEAAIEQWEPAGEGSAAGQYSLEFVHGGRLYRVRFRNEGDYYNIRAVEMAANVALRDIGRPERFQRMVTGDQMAALLFADPDDVQEAADRLLLATEEAGAAIAAAVDGLASPRPGFA